MDTEASYVERSIAVIGNRNTLFFTLFRGVIFRFLQSIVIYFSSNLREILDVFYLDFKNPTSNVGFPSNSGYLPDDPLNLNISLNFWNTVVITSIVAFFHIVFNYVFETLVYKDGTRFLNKVEFFAINMIYTVHSFLINMEQHPIQVFIHLMIVIVLKCAFAMLHFRKIKKKKKTYRNPDRKLVVKGLSLTTTKSAFKEYMEQYGPVSDVIFQYPHTENARCVVVYREPESVTNVLELSSEIVFEDRILQISAYED